MGLREGRPVYMRLQRCIIQDLSVDSLLLTNKSGSQILVAEETFTSLSVSYIEHKWFYILIGILFATVLFCLRVKS